MQGIVFNGHYLTYFDVAFTEYWRATGLPSVLAQAADGRELFARKAAIEYHAPARFDDVLEIGVRCSAIGRSSMRFVQKICRGQELLVSGELVYVYARGQGPQITLGDARGQGQVSQTHSKADGGGKGIPVPDDWRATLLKFEKAAPAVQ